MAWTDPKTWTVGEKIRAADLNAQVRDNLDFLYDAPQIAVRLTAAQEVANATDHTVTWATPVWGTAGMWDAGGPSTIVIPRDGVYTVIFQVLWSEATEDEPTKRAAFVSVNGTRRRGMQVPAVQPSEFQLAVETNLADGDEVTFQVRQTAGEALSLQPLRTLATVRWSSAPPDAWATPGTPADPLGS
jgi:hypothetical protein